MNPIEFITVSISVAVIVTRIVMFVRSPSVTAPTEV
jgi:hypothetical protein